MIKQIHNFTTIIKKEEEWYVATCIDNNVASQGKTIEEATDNLIEAIELFYEDHQENTPIMLPKDHLYVTTLEVAL